MADLRTDFAGLELTNPIIVSSAGITETVEKMRRCQEGGASAVVMKSYFEEEVCRKAPSPRYRVIRHDMGREKTFTFFSYEQASEWDIDRYAEEVRSAKSELDIKIIPSINCITEQGWVEAARKVAEAGADAIELNTSCPHGSITFRGGPVEEVIFQTVARVRQAVGIPLIAKISPMLTSPIGVVERLKEIGVNGVTIFNRMTGLDIDVQSEGPVMHGGYAGHGGPWAIQYPLRWISEISPKIDIHIAGSGGVMSGEDAIKYILAGAQTVQVCTVVVLNGFEVIRDILAGMERWMDAKGYPDLSSFRGKAARSILTTGQVDREQRFTAYIHREMHAPCVHACPARVPAQTYVHRIAQRDFAGALEAIRSANPFQSVCGWACFHPCEAECTRGDMDEPIAIRALKRYAIEWGDRNLPLSQAPTVKAPPTGKRMAVIGAGPAGLTAAHDLARMGHEVTVFESSSAPGGMLRWAIPNHRLPRRIVKEEIAFIERLGVKILCNQQLGEDFKLEDLISNAPRPDGRQRFDAVVIAIGAGQSARLGIPGEEAVGVVGAMKFLKQVASGEGRIAGRRVAVVGGGNTALDAARCALRCGASEVYVVYRRSRQEMPASDEEIALAEQEEVRILYTAMPIRVESSEGFVSGLRVRGGYLDMPKSGHRRSLVPVEGVEYVLPVDQVIVAVSQLPDSGALAGSRGLKVSSAGTIEAVDEFGATALKGVFAAGDAAGWAKAGQPHMASIIEAIASGRKVALNVDSFLSGKGVEDARSRWGESRVVDKRRVLASNIEREPAARGAIPHRDLAERARDFEPVELSLTEQDALREAQRCLRCGCGVGCELCRRICPYFAVKPVEGYGLAVDKELCSGCGLCIERCPIANIDAVPLAKR